MEANTSSILETFKADLDKLDYKHQQSEESAAEGSIPTTSSSLKNNLEDAETAADPSDTNNNSLAQEGGAKKSKPVKRVRMSGTVNNFGEDPTLLPQLINRKTGGAGAPHDPAELENLLNQLPIDQLDLLYVPKNCAEQVEQFAKYVWENGWKAMPHHAVPNWLRDNDFLLKGHRPPLPSAKACFKSIFRIHTETGNIWTHFIGKQ